MTWQIVYARHAQKDARKLVSARLKANAEDIIGILRHNPVQNPHPYEKLVGDLAGAYSRRINIQLRLVYEIFESERTVRILKMWSHCE